MITTAAGLSDWWARPATQEGNKSGAWDLEFDSLEDILGMDIFDLIV